MADLRDLLKQEAQLRITIDSVRRFVQKFDQEQHEDQIDVRVEILDASMKKFYTIRRKIELIVEDADAKEKPESKETDAEAEVRLKSLAEKRALENAEVLQLVEDDYCSLKASLQRLQKKPSVRSSSEATQSTSSATSRVKLPELRLPSFGGRTRDWVTFRDMFRSLIHRNDQLTDMDKFSYLRSSLNGEALQEIDAVEMSAVNYPIAWDLLQKRYENKKLIVKAHLDILFTEEPMKRESYEALSHLITEYDRNLQMLEKIGEHPANWSTILVHMVCSRLDPSTLRHWESHYSSNEVPSYDELMTFLRKHCAVLQSVAPVKTIQHEDKKKRFPISQTFTQTASRCPFCGEASHSAFRCQTFLRLKVPERYEKVKRCGLCLNCFSPSHLVRACTGGACKNCQQKHHTLLHFGSNSSVPSNNNQNRQQRSNNQQTQPHSQAPTTSSQNQATLTQNTGPTTSSHPVIHSDSQLHLQPLPTTDRTPSQNTNSLPVHAGAPLRQVLLSTAVVRVTDPYGNSQYARALLDSCSEYCFISSNLCRKLKLAGSASYLSVTGIGGSVVGSTRKVEAAVFPRSMRISTYSEKIELHVLPKLTSKLPIHRVDVQQFSIPENIILADPRFYEPGPIDIIIGAEYYYGLLAEGRMNMSSNGPFLQSTVLGWVVSGRVPDRVDEIPRTMSFPCTTVDLRELLTKFWELESCNNRSTHSVEESTCEELFDRTTVRDGEGRFVVTLPKKQYMIEQLGDSKAIALKRLFGLERRFFADSLLKNLYTEFIQEYLSMGHMRAVTEEDSDQPLYFMPHHAVLKPESTTTKLRVVFDASCRTTTGVSLNDGLMVGPVVQEDLLSIILRFRFHRVAIVADIAKMYRMVKMNAEDQPLQRILWRDSVDDTVKAFQMTTVTYGTASAPYLATKCLQRLSCEGEATHPAAAKIVKTDFYVDDLLTGSEDVEDGKVLVEEMMDLMNSAGFTLRKWISNSSELLTCVPPDLRDGRSTLELDSSSSPVKTLGLMWEPATDSFRYAVPQWSFGSTITKRVVLSDTARIFDPIGLIGPVVVQAKIFLQKLWKLKCDWDEPLTEEYQDFWLEYRRNLSTLESFSVPRWTNFSSSLISVQLHGFCDASEAAYGACLYLRCVSSDGSVSVRLITAKSKVAPLEDLDKKKRKQSIPRLELSSALLLSHLYEKFCRSVNIPIQAFFWTDSMIVLCWLLSLPSRWQIFIANRVSEIQHITKGQNWRHVAGTENPADIISRGMIPAQLLYQVLWFEGPLWLRQEECTWPMPSTSQPEVDKSLLEERSSVALPVNIHPPFEIFNQRSSFPVTVRIMAYVRRFLYNARPQNRSCRKVGIVAQPEYDEASITLVHIAQRESFPEEFKELEKGRQVKSSSKIKNLNPKFVDGVLRVGGRLANAKVSEDRKHPMILHYQHPLSKLIVSHYHWKFYHAGQQLLITIVRGMYWPTRLQDIARKVIHGCVPCFRSKPKVHEQLMADLPAVRVTPAAVFSKVGVDFCGPFYIRYPVRRSAPVKCYVAIFVCLATKAIHMEVVADLSTPAFLAAFKRFVAIRGKPTLVMCDNATNFVGADRELQVMRHQLMTQQFKHEVIRDCEEDGIEFQFIPARAPNFGGLWEAAVKSFKGHFRKTIGTQILTYDELHTVVQEVSAILNSRPLTPLSNDPNDFEALTPGHFVIGRPLTAVPEPDLQEITDNRLSMWQKAQSFTQQVWVKWRTQYLSELHSRTKWTRERDNIKIGTMVLVKEDNLPPLKWRLGRVSEIFPGSDGNVRVVNIRTKDGLFKRAISKICVLPIQDNVEDSEANEI